MPAQQQTQTRHQIHNIDRSDSTKNACYHWENTMNGGAPKVEHNYKFAAVCCGFWMLILIISWAAYQLTH